MRMATILFLAACRSAPLDTGTAPIPPWLVDDDGDAYSADVDCDDADPGVHPGANERCDGRDQDCDDEVDEEAIDAPRWYSDDDGDGVGATYGFVASCDPVPDTLPTGGDCDDHDAAIHPGATERCNGADDDCDGETDEGDLPDEPTWYADADGDGFGDPADALITCAAPEGYVADATDCDDADATASPAGVETCDGVDEDCDGEVDEDALDGWLFYADLDDDTYGDAGVTMWACRGSDGWMARLGDCDDTDPTISPRGEETCDGVDEDCDGAIDDDAVGARRWYIDADGDGFGTVESAVDACEEPPGAVRLARDCDDTDPTVSPGAYEYCDAFDWDCDGSADGGAIDAVEWYRDADGDGFGDAMATRDACEAPAGYVADATDCADDDAAVHAAVEGVCGDGDDCDSGTPGCDAPGERLLADVGGFRVLGTEGGGVGTTLAHVGDADGDGVDDFVVGVVEAEVASLYPGSATGVREWTAASAHVRGTSGGSLGRAVAGLGDVDGDGLDDVALAAGSVSARVRVVGGGWTSDRAEADATWTYTAGAADSGFSWDVAGVGDLDGDGLADLVFGADLADPGVENGGAVYVFLGGAAAGTTTIDAADGTFAGTVSGARVGHAVAGVGDIDGDGLDDLLVGAPDDGTAGDAAGAAWLVAGPAIGSLTPADAVAGFLGEAEGDEAGAAVAGAGDTDGDGGRELLVASLFAGDEAGKAWLLRGPFAGVTSLAASAARVHGDPGSWTGRSVAGAGDLDGDGLDDIAVGAPLADGGGVVSVWYGGVDRFGDLGVGDLLLLGRASARAGLDLAGVTPGLDGDLTGDGRPDLLVGAPSDDEGGAAAGVVWLVPGEAL